ncbi:DDE_Tnp_1_7 domain-containing protein [Trichonephila clavata]|uniref:DDE_Tnp_1_7 domain-containing protein n=1 Tax=Trichonephila clavata TaxID=2740835 RepID=A0A8X6K526_TRICU|nr:DDE_Tnp_1_7 domain-containing protein [Trichonephila clavata]
MPRKGLDICEALALFQELPSDTESIVSDESSDTEEYSLSEIIESHSNDGSIYDDESDANDINMPGPSQPIMIRWEKRGKIQKTIPNFDSETGTSDEIMNMDDQSPVAIFLALFSVQLMESIVFQSNPYATQSGKNFSPLTLEELILFLAINLTMGVKRLPSYRDYWSTSDILHDPYVSSLMPVKRFTWILGNLHLNDNTLMKKKRDTDFDKLYKLRLLITHLSEKFLSVLRLSKHQAVDESMVKFKGRSSLKQYMPKKP